MKVVAAAAEEEEDAIFLGFCAASISPTLELGIYPEAGKYLERVVLVFVCSLK